MLFTLKSSINCKHADLFVAGLKQSGLPVFAKVGNWRVIAVPGLSEEVLKSVTTRWCRGAVIEETQIIKGCFDVAKRGFADVDAVLV